ALGITIGEEAALQHLVRREADAGNDVSGREGSLLYFSEKVVWIAVEFHHPDLHQRIVDLRPHFGQVEGIVPMSLRLSLSHHLNEKRPFRKVAALDRVEQIAPVALAIVGDER